MNIQPLHVKINRYNRFDVEGNIMNINRIKYKWKDLRVGKLHGRLSSEEKEAVMQAFVRHELDITYKALQLVYIDQVLLRQLLLPT